MALNPSVTTLSGLAADRPASPTYTGLIYFATDTGVTTAWNGASWQAVSGASGSNPDVILATATAAGVATTFVRTDDTIKALDTAAPPTITVTTSSNGTTSLAARSDHSHGHGQFTTGDLHQDYLLAAGTRPLTAQWGVGPFSFLVTGSAAPATPGTTGLRAVWANNDNTGLKVLTKAGNTYSLEGAMLAKSQSATAAGDTIANVAVITDFTTNYTIPANAFSVGRALRLEAYGVFSTSATAVTDTVAVRLDATAVGTTGAVTDNANLANRGWSLDGLLTCRATGSAAGLVEFQGRNFRSMTVSAANVIDMENTAGAFLDTTVSHVIKLSQTWGTANTGNTISLRSLAVEWLGPEAS